LAIAAASSAAGFGASCAEAETVYNELIRNRQINFFTFIFCSIINISDF
jgi:hypothetical protein